MFPHVACMTPLVMPPQRIAASERPRLMLYSMAVLLAVALVACVATALHFRAYVPEPVWRRTTLLAVGGTLVLVIGGGTLLVRVCHPFIRRLEENIAERAAAQEQLEAQAHELARTNRQLDDFTYIASHDLKEPLRGISSYCQILLEDYGQQLDADGQRRMNALVTLCQRLSRLIDDVLNYAHIGRKQPDLAPSDCREIVGDVLSTLGPAIDQRGAVVTIAGELPQLSADRLLLGEVFRNLIGNALKFNDSPQARVEIGCRDGYTFFVRDNGIGIPPCHHEAIFAMFRRLHARGRYDGTGAGLSFVRRIVEAHGGRVWVESRAGEGATFYFTLSAEKEDVGRELAGSAAG